VIQFNMPRSISAAVTSVVALVLMLGIGLHEALAQAASGSGTASKAAHRMRIVHAYPAHTQHGRNMEFFKQKVEAYTDGRVAVTIYPNAELGPINQEMSMILAGTVEASYSIGGIIEAIDPAEALWNIPFLLKVAPGQGEHMRRIMDDKTIQGTLAKRQAAKGLKRLGHVPTLTGFMLVGNNVRAVEKLEDIKGLRIRHPGGLMGELYIRSIGASPMTVTGAEVPVALQQGVVDGLVTTPVHYHDARWHTKFMTLPFYAGYGVPLVASLRWWNTLPADVRDIIDNKVMPETMDFAYKSVIDLENRYIEEMQKPPYNVKISWLTSAEMERFAGQVRDQAIERFVKATGADGQPLIDQVKKLGEGIEIKR
jgi:TRAP-type C4-dicarboxylate transport system substrate-binding protein